MLHTSISNSFLKALKEGNEKYGTKFTQKVINFITKLNEDNYSGVSQERINHKNKYIWSGRASEDYRVIFFQQENSRVLLYVDKHDDAYNWIKNRDFKFQEKSNELHIKHFEEIEEEKKIIEHNYQKQKMFDRYSDEYLISVGVPSEFILTLRQFEVTEETKLLNFIDNLNNFSLSSIILNLATDDINSIFDKNILRKESNMKFHPYEPFDQNAAQIKVWNWLKEAFKDDEGISYYRYPVFTKQGNLNREPDILMLHRKYGLWIFECKSYKIHNIKSIHGHDWQLKEWLHESETPVAQAEDQMFAIQNIFNSKRNTRGKVNCNFRVVLPNISLKDWVNGKFDELPSVQGCILCYENLTPISLKQYIEENSSKNLYGDQDWESILAVLGGTINSKPARRIISGTSENSPVRVIQLVEEKIKSLDEVQQKIAFEIPDGPQRLRGLAGTGKTVLLAKKAVKMHIKNPSWKIGFIFFTRSLYDQVIDLITLFHKEMHPDSKEPNWSNLKILHAWGSKEQDGFYRTLCHKVGARFMYPSLIKKETGLSSPSEQFEHACISLNKGIPQNINSIYDAIIIDEGQDLPPTFYQLAYKFLSEPKRLYWGYDEAQGIGSLIIPTSETIFGRNEDKSLVVDLSGSYSGGILKTHKMKKCYRTPRLLLMTAHAINMGLFRQDGSIQGVTRIQDWEDLGYKITDGDFSVASVSNNKMVTITRPDSESPHPIDQKDFKFKDALGSVLTVQTFSEEEEERIWVAQQISQDIKNGLNPSDILVTAINGNNENEYFSSLKTELKKEGIESYIAGVDGNASIFRTNNCITLSSIFRAKGNEAWKTYATRFQYVNHPLNWKNEGEVHKRNEAFVALSRSKLWSVVTGIESPIFEELKTAISQGSHFTFKSFNQSSLSRIIDE